MLLQAIHLIESEDLSFGTCAAWTSQYDFWAACAKFLNTTEDVPVDKRRHDQIVHLATAISMSNFVSKLCPDGTKVPSEQWFRLQFWPKDAWQQWILYLILSWPVYWRDDFWMPSCQSHLDTHYATALLQYLPEFAVVYHDSTTFVCVYD